MTWTWLLLPAVLAGIGWMVWKGIHDKPKPADSIRFENLDLAPLEAFDWVAQLCSTMGWGGCVIQWFEGRIPAGYGPETCDAQMVDPWKPVIQCRNLPAWRALLAHEAGHVEKRRRGESGEPDPAWVAEVLASLSR